MIHTARDVVAPILLVVFALLVQVDLVILTFVVFGYAHFIHGYAYRVRSKGQHWAQVFLVPTLIIGGLLSYFYFGGSAFLVLVLTPIIFSSHFAYDEFFLKGEEARLWEPGAISFTLLATILSLSYLLPGAHEWALIAGLIPLAVIAYRLLSRSPSPAEQYLGLVSGFLYLFAALGRAELVIGVVVLLHCINWYYWGHARSRVHDKTNVFWRDTTLSLVCIGAVYAVSLVWVPLAPLFASATYFYIYYPFALAHIATSMRFGMLRG